MKNRKMSIWVAVCLSIAGFAAAGMLLPAQDLGTGQAIVTIVPKHEGALPSSITQQDFLVKVNGQKAKVTLWTPYRAADDRIELVLLIDGSARNSLAQQWGDMARFIQNLPPNTRAGIAYMANGRSLFAGPLSTDRAEVLKNLHLQAGAPGSSASPYFCISDLAKNWPSHDTGARRAVLMISDGIDPYQPEYNPDDPYLQSAINDSVRAHIAISAIYWENRGRMSQNTLVSVGGQNLMSQLADATGGRSFYQGTGNPVSLVSYFDGMVKQLGHQYKLEFEVPFHGHTVVGTMQIKIHAPETEIIAPHRVLVTPVTK
ncbi:MAG: hypothetical protein P4K83_11220 [Terracidiphilus sp.]|nr:hypothetical protein [Terracidiphilus sp.]